jgi:predicted RNase H-like HicB family nuclease
MTGISDDEYNIPEPFERLPAFVGLADRMITFEIELSYEDDGRIIAEIPAIRGCMVYGDDRESAIVNVQATALRIIARALETGEAVEFDGD